jgi:nucleotide-binding universal stress UspA family protein
VSFTTLMVHLEIGRANSALLKFAGELADRFGANLIGIAACQPMQVVYADGYMPVDVMEQSRREMDGEMQQTEAEFRDAFRQRSSSVAWRSTMINGSLSDYIAAQARSADLVVTGLATGGFFDPSRSANTGELIMQVGRPVMVVPAAVDSLRMERVLICWKDTREARRAIVDALPLLKKANHISVLEVPDAAEFASARLRLDDVVNWLNTHGVSASAVEATPPASLGGDAGDAIYALANELGIDIIIAGAYGHSRVREWALGGVTKDLLMNTNRCSVLSH